MSGYRCTIRAKESGKRGHSFYHHDDATLTGAAIWLGRIERAVVGDGGEIIVMTIAPKAGE
jgi:hypothetical protein